MLRDCNDRQIEGLEFGSWRLVSPYSSGLVRLPLSSE